MPWSQKSKPVRSERVVKHVLRDGSVKEYRYPAYSSAPIVHRTDTVYALITAWQNSPEWRGLSPATQRSYVTYLKPLSELGHSDIKSIKRKAILAIRDALASDSGNAAANKFVSVSRKMFEWGIDRELLEINPVTKIENLEGGHYEAWTPEQAEIAIRKLPEQLRRVVILGMFTGQRRTDLCRIMWSDYDGSHIRVAQQKTGAKLVIPTHPDLQSNLNAWKQTATAVTILTNAHGRPWVPVSLSQLMPKALTRIGLTGDLNVHGLRKLAAANLADAGCSTLEIMAITGHATLSMVELYTKSADQKKRATAAIGRLQTIYKEKDGAEKPRKPAI